MSTCLILPCAGSSERFGATKQLVQLNGDPLFVHSLLPFIDLVDQILIPCTPQIVDDIHAGISFHPFKNIRTLEGGSTRLHSVFNAFQFVDESITKILVHDAARPCISQTIIKQCIDALDKHQAIITATPCTDTLKEGTDGSVTGTIDRRGKFLAQTPQGFIKDLGIPLYKEAIDTGAEVTDDASLFEAAGIPVHVIPGSRANIKVTYPEDLALISALLETKN